jgi:hypothetical protein
MRKFSSAPAEESEPVQPTSFPFELDKVVFTAELKGDADSVLEWSELAQTAASENADLETIEGAAFVARFFRLMIPPAEYKRFRAHLREHDTHPDVLVQIMQALNEEMEDKVQQETARPTEPSAPSSSGQGETDERRLQIIALSARDGDVEYVDAPPSPRRQPRKAPQDHKQRQPRRRAG